QLDRGCRAASQRSPDAAAGGVRERLIEDQGIGILARVNVVSQRTIRRIETRGIQRPIAPGLTHIEIDGLRKVLRPLRRGREPAEEVEESVSRIGEQVVLGQGGQLRARITWRTTERQAVENRVGWVTAVRALASGDRV